MKNFKLDKEEKEILEAFERGEFVSIMTDELRREHIEAAKETLKRIKDKNINIRIAGQDLIKLKTKSSKSGLPYQTVISTLIHQYINNKIEIKL